MAANSVNVACLRSHAAGPAKTIVNRRGNVTNEFYAQFHFMRQHQRNKAQGERVSLPGRAIQSSSLCTHCVRVCVCVCRVVPYLLFSSASCCYSGRLFALLFLPLSLMLTSNGVGKNPIRRRMCRVWRFKNHRSLFFHSFVCECVSFSFPFAGLRRSGVEGEGQGKCVSIVALRMNHAHFKLIYSTVAF